jgi:hypothetical protein
MAEEEPKQKSQADRMAMGMALGAPAGVLLSVLLDNWGLVGVGIALGAALGLAFSERSTGDADTKGPELEDEDR